MRFSKFSNEIKYDIFSKFTTEQLCQTVAPICREWRQFAYSSIYWKHVELGKHYDGKDEQSDEQMLQVLKHCKYVPRLEFYYTSYFSWIYDTPVCYTLRHLEIYGCAVCVHILSKFVTVFPYMEIFSYVYCHNIPNPEIESVVRWRYLKMLRIGLAESEIDANTCLDLVAANCNNLTQFVAEKFTKVKTRSLNNFLIKLGPQLTSLSISGLRNVIIPYEVLSKCRRLTHLELKGARYFNDNDLLSLGELRHLKCLEIGKSKKLFSSEFANLFSKVKFLPVEHMVIDKCVNLTNSALNIFIKSCCSEIKYLKVVSTKNIKIINCQIMANKYGFHMKSQQQGETITVEFKKRTNV